MRTIDYKFYNDGILYIGLPAGFLPSAWYFLEIGRTIVYIFSNNRLPV